jgi:hypothetical protein
VRALIAERTGRPAEQGPIRVLTHPRVLGIPDQKFPKTPHIGVYPRPSAAAIASCSAQESPANRSFLARNPPGAGVVAMQKVEGSNPFSRFASNPLHLGQVALAGQIKPPPHIASLSLSGGATVAAPT